jgi:hypothetical protein
MLAMLIFSFQYVIDFALDVLLTKLDRQYKKRHIWNKAEAGQQQTYMLSKYLSLKAGP